MPACGPPYNGVRFLMNRVTCFDEVQPAVAYGLELSYRVSPSLG